MRQWYTMTKTIGFTNKEEIKSAEIVIYDEIGQSWWNDDAISAKDFVSDLKDLGDVDQITLRINSPGGDVFDGVAIHNAIKTHPAKVTAQIDGIAASAASFIAMAADKIVMPENSFMLIHGASGFSMGNADDMRSVAADLDRIDKSLTSTYATRAKTSATKVKALMKEDRLMDASEAVELGYADEVAKPVKMAAKFSLRLLPEAAAVKFKAVAEKDDPPPVVEPEKPADPPVAEPAKPDTTLADPPAAAHLAAPHAPQGASGQVITLDVAKKQGADEHRAYVASVTDLCTLASTPERVGSYVRANTPVEAVRKELLELKAAAPAIMPQHPLVDANKVPATMWTKITDKLNAKLNK